MLWHHKILPCVVEKYSCLLVQPCGNPDCLYLHDARAQEDTLTKDEAISTCSSKFQHSPGSALNYFQRRSGHFLPPPVDEFCSNNNVILSKPLGKPVAHSPGGYSKNILSDDDAGKSGGLPAAASWGLRANPGRLPVTNALVSQGPSKNEPIMSNGSLISCVGAKAQNPTQTCSTDQHVECIGTSLSNGRLETFPSSELCKEDGQTRQTEPHIVVSVEPTAQLNGIVSLEASNLDPEPGASSTPQDLPLSDEQTCGSSEMGIEILAARDLEEKNRSPTLISRLGGDLSSFSTGGLVVDQIVDEASSSSAPGVSLFPNGEKAKLSNWASGSQEVSRFPNTGYGFQKKLSLEKVGSQNSVLCEETNVDKSEENNIIGNILSLDLGLDDSLVSPHNLAKLLRGESDRITGDSKLYSSSKPGNNNKSRFSFARMDEFNQESDRSFTLSTYEFGQREISDLQGIADNDRFQVNKFPNGITVSDLGSSEILNSHQHLSSTMDTDLHSHSRPGVSPPSRLLIQRKPPHIPPPGFNPQYMVDRDQSFTVIPSSGSNAQHLFLGSSAHLNSPQQIVGNSIHPDVEFVDPAIMEISRGKLPMSSTHLFSPNFSSNLSGFSEIDQGLRLLTSRSTNFNHNSMMVMDQSRYNLLQDMDLQEANFNHNSMMVMDQSEYNLLQDMALQETMRNSNGPWGAWNMTSPNSIESASLLSRRGQESLAEIRNNGRVGYLDPQYGFLRPFPPTHEDTRFQTSNPGSFYNPAYGI
ncbi:uncharacterized protein LOC143891640 isoform X2 [Tasmannia lanceolata]|uniref:uncharacterized protein LOC143891640 isoform X2 n=1 Tax=Tasmannia lanceolata TaxID=3420 RepID=UPI0040635448